MSYYLQYIVGLKKNDLDDSNAQMNFGTAVHLFLENHFLGNKVKNLGSQYVEPRDIPRFSLKALDLFCTSYLKKYVEADKEFEVLDIEDVSEFELEGHTFLIKRDGALKLNGNIFGLEHKTTKSISQMYFDKYYMNSQITAQVADVKDKYGQCEGIMLNVGEIKHLKRKPTAKYDGVEQLDDGTYIACKFERDFINRQECEIEDWKQNTVQWINRIELSKKKNDWPKSTGLWGGSICNSCEYRELCKFSKGTDLDEATKQMLYKEVNPFEYLETNT